MNLRQGLRTVRIRKIRRKRKRVRKRVRKKVRKRVRKRMVRRMSMNVVKMRVKVSLMAYLRVRLGWMSWRNLDALGTRWG